MFIRGGLLLAAAAILLQIAVYLQPLLPEQYHIAPVCMSITHNLLSASSHHQHEPAASLHSSDASHAGHRHHHLNFLDDYKLYHHDTAHNEHNHQCQYCTVYGDLVMPPILGVAEVFDRVQVRLIAFEQAFKHVYFALQKLYLMPQGRAPPAALF